MATIKGDDFKRAVAVCSPVARNDKYPILKSVMLRIDGGTAYFEATNLSQCVQFECEAEGEFEGLLDTQMLQTRAAVISPQPLSVERLDGVAVVKQGRAVWKMPIPSADDAWPSQLFVAGSDSVLVSGQEFINACQKASYAMEAIGPTRHMLQGVHVKDGMAIGFDGKRMSVEPVGLAGGYTIPSESIGIIMKLFRDAGQISVSRREGWVSLLSDVLSFSTKTIEEPYPDWTKYISEPKTGAADIKADRAQLIAAIGRVSAANFARGKLQKIKIETTGSQMKLSASHDGEMNEDAIECDGDQTEMFVNSEYISQALESVEGDETDMRYWPETHQCIIRDRGRKRLVMALRG